MTQQDLADAAGVSLSTVRRLERDPDARFQLTTEMHLERVLGLRSGALMALRRGKPLSDLWRKPSIFNVESHRRFGAAPLGELAACSSRTARVLADQVHQLAARREEELSLLSQGQLWPGSGEIPGQWLFEWLPWPAQLTASATWLDRMFDSCDQIAQLLVDGEVPLPLRLAEAVALRISHDRAWALDTNHFFDPATGDEIIDEQWPDFDELFAVADPRPLFGDGEHANWVSSSSYLHPFRWWQRADRAPRVGCG